MMSKPRCDYCPATYLSRYTDSEGKTCHKCLAHLPNDINTDFDRYEHLILNEIKKTLPSSEYYKEAKIISPKYDKGLMRGVRQRPDLIIRSPLQGKNIVIVEVDEGYHSKEEQRRLDREREEFFREKLTEKARDERKPIPSISFVRIEAFDLEDNSIVGKMQKMVVSPGKKSKKVVKTGDFEGVLRTSIREIRKKLTRRNPGTQTIKITPDNYQHSFSLFRAPLKSPYSRIFPRRRSTLDRGVKKFSPDLVDFENQVSNYKYNHMSKTDIYKTNIAPLNRHDFPLLKVSSKKDDDENREWAPYRDDGSRYRLELPEHHDQPTREPYDDKYHDVKIEDYTKVVTPTELPKKITLSPKKQSNNKPFNKEQKSKISKLLKNGKDYSEYLGSIYGEDYKKSGIKLSSLDPIPVHLHVIQGAALGHSDSELLKGVEKLRKMSLTTNMPMVKAAKTDLINRNSEKTSAKSYKEIYSSRLIDNRDKEKIASSLKNEISLLESPHKKPLSPPTLPKKTTPPHKKSLSPPRSKEVVFPRRNRAESPKTPKKTTPPRKKSLSPAKKSTGFFSFLGF